MLPVKNSDYKQKNWEIFISKLMALVLNVYRPKQRAALGTLGSCSLPTFPLHKYPDPQANLAIECYANYKDH